MQLREINLNGYIDEDVFFGDEITPDALHEELYQSGDDPPEDVHIRLNSYGGSCNAATRMYDDLAAYPGKVFLTVSGTAASAATVVAMAADRLEMTPGSLWMIHNPSMVAAGNEQDLQEAISVLRACKESIINVYAKRCRMGHDSISDMMDRTTWMDSQAALMNGFIDSIADSAVGGPSNCVLSRADVEKKVRAWVERHRTKLAAKNAVREEQAHETEVTNACADTDKPEETPEAPSLAQDEPDEAPASAPEMAHDAPEPAAEPAHEDVENAPVEAPVAAESAEKRVSVVMLEKRLNSLKLQLV